MEKIEDIISRSKVLIDRLRLAITKQNNITQDGFDTNGLEFSNVLNGLENTLVSSEKKLQNIQKEVTEVKEKIINLSEEFERISEENSDLTRKENTLLSLSEATKIERLNKAQLVQDKVKIYKTLTGVRFDFNNSTDGTLTGYIALSSNKPAQCSLIPFEIDKNDSGFHLQLWEKIKEANLKFIECK